jgi:hypothetical protein
MSQSAKLLTIRSSIGLLCLVASSALAAAATPRAAMPVRMLPARPQPAAMATPFNQRVASPFQTPINQFSPFFNSTPFFQFAPRQQVLSSFQFNSSLFNTRFGFPFASQNRLFERQVVLQQRALGFNPFLTSQSFNRFTFNPSLGTNQLGAFSPFMNTSFSPFMNPGFTNTASPFMFPSTGTSMGGF